jgi:proteasome accessory factor C
MSGALSGRQRLERALAIVPWIDSQGGTAAIEDVCKRFDLDVEQLQSCLETVSMVGVYPYTPDALLEVFLESDHVHVNLPDYFTRPLRLTPTQTFGLIAAGRALLSLPGTDPEGPLARAIAKVSAATGAGGAVAVDLDTAPIEILQELQSATAAFRMIEIDYYSYSRDAWSTRRVDPWRVQSIDGKWYLEGHCHSAQDIRVFRLDRIRDLKVLEATFEAPELSAPLEIFDRSADLPMITLDLEPAATWVANQYPTASIEQLANGRVRVTLAVSARPWLERLLLRLGDDVRIVQADASLHGVLGAGARRVLQRYLH